MTIKCLIVDDEAPARSEMRYLLSAIEGVQVLGEASTAEEALELLEAVCYDIVFLDINMPGTSGLDLVGKLKSLSCLPAVIFTTAYGQHAVKAFELEAADYLVKPIGEERLRKAVSRVRARVRGPRKTTTTSLDAERTVLDRIPVTKQSKTILLCPSEILYIESHGEYAVIHSSKGNFISSYRLKDFEARLSGKTFFRAHRGYVVNLDFVAEMVALYGGLYMLKLTDADKSEIPVSRRQTRLLKQALGMK